MAFEVSTTALHENEKRYTFWKIAIFFIYFTRNNVQNIGKNFRTF